MYEPGYDIDSKRISSIFEDSRAYLYVGARGSVYRFDGMNYQAIHLPDSFAEVEVTSIHVSNNQILAGLSTGLVLRTPTAKPHTFDSLCHLSATITDMLVDQNNNIWIATYGDGLMFINPSGELRHFNESNNLPDNYLYDLEMDYSGNIWVGTDAGLVKIRLENEQPVFSQLQLAGMPDLIVMSLAIDEQNRLWMGFLNGSVCHYLVDEDRLVVDENPKKTQNPVTSICRLDDDLWIGTTADGLYCYSISSQNIRHFSRKPFDTGINKLINSQLGGIWIAGNEQLVYSAGKQIEFYYPPFEESISPAEVHALLLDSRGHLWFCTEQGLFRKPMNAGNDAKAEKWSSENAHDKVFFTCLFEDSYGYIWAGTYDHGALRIDPTGKAHTWFNESKGLANNNVLRIDGKENDLWFATLGGASHAQLSDLNQVVFVESEQQQGPGNNYVYSVFIDSRNRVWFGTDGNGPGYIEKDRYYSLIHPELNQKVVYSVAEDQQGGIWFVVSGEGIYRLLNDTLSHIGLDEGLASLQITSLSATNSIYMLAVSHQGIDLINSYTLEVVSTCKSFGIMNLKPDLNAIDCSSNGDCYVGSQDGFIRLKNISGIANRKPILNLNEWVVNLTPVAIEQHKRLQSHQNQIVYRFTGIWYPAPEDVTYRHKLDGLDGLWQKTRNNEAVYANLAPKEYTWHIQASLNQKFYPDDEQVYRFIIRKPFFQQWWVILLSIIFIAAFLFWLIRARIEKLRLIELQKQKQLEFEYQSLRNQVNPHFLFNSFSTLMSVIETDSGQAVDYVGKLSDYFRNILQYRDSQLIQLKEELRLLETYIFLQQKRYGSSLIINISLADEILQTFIPPMSLQMLAENAMKHNLITRQNPLQIRIYHEKDYLIVSNDLQLRKSPEASTGLGLKNISERYRIFAGKSIEVEKTQEKFIVKLPLIH